MGLNNKELFLFCPRCLRDSWIEVVVPSAQGKWKEEEASAKGHVL
jgi:hypothetical protein